jgi:hypothetical protein
MNASHPAQSNPQYAMISDMISSPLPLSDIDGSHNVRRRDKLPASIRRLGGEPPSKDYRGAIVFVFPNVLEKCPFSRCVGPERVGGKELSVSSFPQCFLFNNMRRIS